MKKSTLCIAATILLFSFASVQMKASTNPVPMFVTITTAIEPTKSETMVARLNEIKAIDKSTLTSVERKALRKETRSLKQALQVSNGGVYLTTGAIILIAVLLIILL